MKSIVTLSVILLSVCVLSGCGSNYITMQYSSDVTTSQVKEDTYVLSEEELRVKAEQEISDFEILNKELNTQEELCTELEPCFVYEKGQETNAYVRYYIRYEQGGGAVALFAKPTAERNSYELVYMSQDTQTCELIESLNIPLDIDPVCVSQEGIIINRETGEKVI
jgi:outer membrane murein-binding lipoprotein Lpp